MRDRMICVSAMGKECGPTNIKKIKNKTDKKTQRVTQCMNEMSAHNHKWAFHSKSA